MKYQNVLKKKKLMCFSDLANTPSSDSCFLVGRSVLVFDSCLPQPVTPWVWLSPLNFFMGGHFGLTLPMGSALLLCELLAWPQPDGPEWPKSRISDLVQSHLCSQHLIFWESTLRSRNSHWTALPSLNNHSFLFITALSLMIFPVFKCFGILLLFLGGQLSMAYVVHAAYLTVAVSRGRRVMSVLFTSSFGFCGVTGGLVTLSFDHGSLTLLF